MRQRAMEAMTGDSHIDRVSRVMFPLTFFLFNVVYWFAYLSHRQAEIVHNTVDHKNDDANKRCETGASGSSLNSEVISTRPYAKPTSG